MVALDLNLNYWMNKALAQAQKAFDLNEVPVGAVLLDKYNNLISSGHNRMILDSDPSAHAEIMALRNAGLKTQNYRFPGSTLIVTLEPCMMCVGALIHARVSKIIFGAYDEKSGALGSQADLSKAVWVNHRSIEILGGVEQKRCSDLLQTFFKTKRASSNT